MWYGENRSGRMEPWAVGDLVRYDEAPTALLRINFVCDMGPDQRGCAARGMNRWRYYGRAFHDQISHYDDGQERASIGRYHGQCLEPSAEDRALWGSCRDDSDAWIRGAWGAATAQTGAVHESAVAESQTPNPDIGATQP